MKPAVRQTKGPGMNLGLKKPRFGFSTPKPYVPSKATKDTLKTTEKSVSKGASYLPEDKPGKPKKTPTSRGKGSGMKML